MEHNMVFHTIDFGQGNFNGADHVAFEEALVVDINLYHSILRIVFVQFLQVQEQMLVKSD